MREGGRGRRVDVFMVETIAILAGRRLRANETGGFVYGNGKRESWRRNGRRVASRGREIGV